MTDIPFYSFFTASGVGKTGLTPTINVYQVNRADGTASLLVNGASMVEVGGGWYRYLLVNANLLTYDYPAIGVTADATVDAKHVSAGWTDFTLPRSTELARLDQAISTRSVFDPATSTVTVGVNQDKTGYYLAVDAPVVVSENQDKAGYYLAADAPVIVTENQDKQGYQLAEGQVDITGIVAALLQAVLGSYGTGTVGGALGRIGTGDIATFSPVPSGGGAVQVYKGDDYLAGDNRALRWTDTTGSVWPDMPEGTTVSMFVQNEGADLEAAGSVIVGTGPGKIVQVELTDTVTSALETGPHSFKVVVTIGETRTVTIIQGKLLVKEY